MRKLTMVVMLMVMVFITACKSNVTLSNGKKYDCVGVWEVKDSTLVYKASVRNIVWGSLFFSLIAPPVLVVVNEFYCPVAVKPAVLTPLTIKSDTTLSKVK